MAFVNSPFPSARKLMSLLEPRYSAKAVMTKGSLTLSARISSAPDFSMESARPTYYGKKSTISVGVKAPGKPVSTMFLPSKYSWTSMVSDWKPSSVYFTTDTRADGIFKWTYYLGFKASAPLEPVPFVPIITQRKWWMKSRDNHAYYWMVGKWRRAWGRRDDGRVPFV